jgi:hypothetical protein
VPRRLFFPIFLAHILPIRYAFAMTDETITVGSARAFKWYFTQRFGNLLSVPLFLVLASMFHIALVGTLLKIFALLKVTWAVYGLVGMVALFFLTWMWGVLLCSPAAIYFVLMTYPAVAWSDLTVSRLRRARNIILVLLTGFVSAWALHTVGYHVIGWIADHNPCAAWQAGVTGSIQPTDCN